MKPTAYIFYHYMPPDDVVSAVLLGDLCTGLARRGWQIRAYPCVWGCHDDTVRFSKEEDRNGFSIRRIWRPRFPQSSGLGRLLNAIWMVIAWSMLALRPGPAPDIIVVGTDPVLSLLVAVVWKLVHPKTHIAHWCLDLYPEAAIADGLLAERALPSKVIRFLLGGAYRKCSLIGDLGPCMRTLLAKYSSDARRETLVPWALEESPTPLLDDLAERSALFGDAKLALLYSGSFGRAHSYAEILDLTELLDPGTSKVVFSIRGNRETELKNEVRKRNVEIAFVDFAPPEKLKARLACADVHIVSLRSEWTGTVVPSKFFGAIAAGRPVLFSGSLKSSIARWIRKYDLGWVLTPENVSAVASALRDYAGSSEQQRAMRERCWSMYRLHFSKDVQIDRWDTLLSTFSASRIR
jgi:colanic acid biosynthesis glycosyl transferase WcaI